MSQKTKKEMLNTPAYRELAFYQDAMTGKLINDNSDELQLVKNIRKHFRTSPDLKPLLPYVRGGVRLFNFLFDGQKAAEAAGLPKGYTLKPIEVETSSKRGEQEIRVVEWIIRILMDHLKVKEVEEQPMSWT
jgi:hypothetical protein